MSTNRISQRWVLALSLTVASISLAERAEAVQIYGLLTTPTDPNGNYRLVSFDSATPGTFTVIGSTGLNGGNSVFVNSLDFDGTGNLYLMSHQAREFLYSVNVNTGAASVIGGSNLANGYTILDMSWDPARNRMLAIAGDSGSTSRLYEVDLSSGALTDLGAINNLNDGFGISLGVDVDGTIYAHGVATDTWYRINPNTLNATALNVLPFGTNFGQGGTIDWSGDGTLYHAAFNSTSFNGELWTIDKTNGNATFVGTLGTNIDSLIQITDIAIFPIPEPTSMALMAIGGIGCLILARRYRDARQAA